MLVAARPAAALNLTAVYFAACQRDLGVIVDVDEARVSLLTLEGELRRIPRFDIIYVAQYPIGRPPMTGLGNGQETRIVAVTTLFEGQEVDLVQGWLIDYSDKQLSFLTTAGEETVIDIDDIWDIRIVSLDRPLTFANQAKFRFDFQPPYPFQECPRQAAPGETKSVRRVFPQYLLGEPLLIKKELDRLQAGHQSVQTFVDNKPFYAVPQVYGTHTDLGVWVNAGSRYGASDNRTNTMIPMVRSQLSDGPFRFQRLWVTGVAPIPFSIHDEPQTQFYYRLKSDYLHFSVMYDVARMLIGEQTYRWRQDDLEPQDDRINEIFHIGGGFDRGRWAFDYTITRAQYAVRNDDLFFFSRANLNKLGVSFRQRSFQLDFYHAFATDRKPPLNQVAEGNSEEDLEKAEALLAAIPDFSGDFRIYRMNLNWLRGSDVDFRYSAIYRKLLLHRQPNLEGLGELSYKSISVTNAVYMTFPLPNDLTLLTYLALETLARQFGVERLTDDGANTYGKAGAAILLRI